MLVTCTGRLGFLILVPVKQKGKGGERCQTNFFLLTVTFASGGQGIKMEGLK